ncbi:sulfurtransferase [Neobacillus piezotolerans]|uniref:Sulfurtransferase n=1 Tax=Neobacillus piezotolerans TaxID=2259171 RepID=A0A3D8GNB6_9BACI|nr:sulfurtransferase [Neobacillus piezotolerans]RDU35970.1 sulfurtransferase [Neobacillus piezotolerans]
MVLVSGYVLALILSILLSRRYVPVLGVPCRAIIEGQTDGNDILVDIRDYSTSSKNPVKVSLHIPAAYLDRYASEIPGDRVLIIASDRLEKNWGIRELRKKGINVVAYTLDGCGCQ